MQWRKKPRRYRRGIFAEGKYVMQGNIWRRKIFYAEERKMEKGREANIRRRKRRTKRRKIFREGKWSHCYDRGSASAFTGHPPLRGDFFPPAWPGGSETPQPPPPLTQRSGVGSGQRSISVEYQTQPPPILTILYSSRKH